VNCTLKPYCREFSVSDEYHTERGVDAILCHECVTRAELVFRRWAKVEETARGGQESGYVSAAAQVTSDHDGVAAFAGVEDTGGEGSDA
jgi:hypothetical protein